MSLLSEFYLGVVLGLCWSFKSLLSNLPCDKVSFFCTGLALYLVLGGFSYGGKLKLAVGLLTFLAFRRSDQLLNVLCEPACRLLADLFGLARTTLEAMTADTAGRRRGPSEPHRHHHRRHHTRW